MESHRYQNTRSRDQIQMDQIGTRSSKHITVKFDQGREVSNYR